MPRPKLPDTAWLKIRVPNRMKRAIFRAATEIGVTATDYTVFVLDAWLKKQRLYEGTERPTPAEAEQEARRRSIAGKLKRRSAELADGSDT